VTRSVSCNIARRRGLLALSKQEVCLPPPTGSRNNGGLLLALLLTSTPQAPEGYGRNSPGPLRGTPAQTDARYVCPPIGGRFNGWLAESAVSILLCFNRHLGFKSVVIKIIPFAADVHPCTILATPCIHARRMSSHAPFYCGRTSCAEAKNFYLFQLLFVYINRKWYERDYSI
jgi:hypothetical protein